MAKAIIRLATCDEHAYTLEVLAKLLQARQLPPEGVLPLARAVGERTTKSSTRSCPPTEDPAVVGQDRARGIVTAAALLLAVPVATWAGWIAALPNPKARMRDLVWEWEWTWSALSSARSAGGWTAARRAQAVEVLTAAPPTVPVVFANTIVREWRDGTGSMGQRLTPFLPDEILQYLRERASYDTTVRPLADVAAERTPLVDREAVRRLTHVPWSAQPGPVRCGVAHRCDYEVAGGVPRLDRALDALIAALISPDAEDPWTLPILRAVVRAQPTSAARNRVVAYLAGVLLYHRCTPWSLLSRDHETLSFCADAMSVAPVVVEEEDYLASLVRDAWPMLDPAQWARAAARMVEATTNDHRCHRMRVAVQAWWTAQDPATRGAPAALVTACLASADRALATWAMIALVPQTAMPTEPGETARGNASPGATHDRSRSPRRSGHTSGGPVR